ncbi:MAG: flavin prenyltransferase UbiX [Planctomycetota bacterium]|nr:flavin prenyltransferase UbiX [Planctomycetota bacterium]
MTTPQLPIVLAITGASGAIYAVRLLETLLAAGRDVYVTVSSSGVAVIEQELGVRIALKNLLVDTALNESALIEASPQVRQLLLRPNQPAEVHDYSSGQLQRGRAYYCHYQDMMSSIASGSFLTGGMVVAPCSGSTLAAIACSLGSNLIHRAAEVHLKERRKLILVPRETPLSLPQIENMRRATEAGAVILPASPGFYHGAESVADLVDFVVGRNCDQLQVGNALIHRWGTE